MSSYAFGGDPPGLAGKYHYGVGSVGIPGSLLNAAGYIYPSITGADLAKEYYGLITSIPAGLTIDVGEAGDFDASAADGTYVAPWDLYEWAVKLGSTSFSVQFGNLGPSVNLVIANLASAATLSTVAVGVTAPGPVRNLAVSNLVSNATISTAAVSVIPGAGAGSSFNYIRFTLEDVGKLPLPNLSGLKFALFSQATPDLFGAPVFKGAAETTDGAAAGEIPVPAATVPLGRYFFVLTNSDGTTTQDPPPSSVCLPVMVVT